MEIIPGQKKIFITVCLVLFYSIVFAQDESTKYRFNVLGWTLALPGELKVVDSATQRHIIDKGRKALEETNDIKIPQAK